MGSGLHRVLLGWQPESIPAIGCSTFIPRIRRYRATMSVAV
jgi:hypothetical protein